MYIDPKEKKEAPDSKPSCDDTQQQFRIDLDDSDPDFLDDDVMIIDQDGDYS